MILKLRLLLFVCLIPLLFFAQKTEHGVTYRDMAGDNYFRLHYDNDYFVSRDQNYTQGFNFERVSPFFVKNPVNYLFPKPQNRQTKYGVSFEHLMFTPEDLRNPEIQPEARPFAASFMMNSFMIATDTINKTRFTASLSLGIIGPGAFGEEMQVSFHKLTDNIIPEGWRYQIQNDVILNYDLSYEKQFLRYRNIFTLTGLATVRAGTLFTNASVGINSAIGILNTPFTSFTDEKRFQIYIYGNPQVNGSAYDATLQGGLFNGSSPHTLTRGQIEPFTAQLNYGIVMQTDHLYAEFTRTQITRQVEKGTALNWGGVRMGVRW